MIRNPNDIQDGAKKIRMLIAGYPGIGKSTLALSAPRPLHIDCDFGIQCSFMGCAGYVVIGDTLVNPATAYDSRGLLPAGPQNRIWYMPLFSTDVWYMRRQIAQMNLLFEPKGEPAKIEKTDIKPANLQKSIKNEPKAPENEPLNETKTGQLTFF